jgi:DNA polymerase III subunit delta
MAVSSFSPIFIKGADMDYDEFLSSVKGGNIASCYVFEGIEEYIKASALGRLRELIVLPGLQGMNDMVLVDPDADTLIAAAETLPVMAEKRLIVVKECGMLSGKAREYNESLNADKLAAYLKQLPATVCIVFYVRGKSDGRKKLYTALKKSAAVVLFDPLDERKLAQWIAQTLKKMGRRIQVDACAQLPLVAGTDLTRLYGELCKLAAYTAGSDAVTRADIEAVCIKTTEYKVFDMASALLAGEGERAFELTQGILRDGEDALFLLALLYRQIKQMQFAGILAGERMSEYEIGSRIGIPSFVVQRIIRQAKSYTAEQLEEMTNLCLDTEYGIKSGQLPADGALEMIMLRILSMREEKR